MFASKTAARFAEGLVDPQSTQQRVLRERIVGPNVGSAFGVAHDFARITTLAEYRAAVPIRKYDDFAPWIDRIVQGEQGVLTTERVQRFFMTSGSTSSAKYIPVTRSFVQAKSQAFGVYWAGVFEAHPAAKAGRMVTNFSDSGKPARAPGGLPCGSESAYWASVTRATQRTERPLVPKLVAQIADADARYYALARILLEESFAVIMTLNPSTIVLLLSKLAEHALSLADDLQHGTLGDAAVVDDVVRDYVTTTYAPNPARAEALRELHARGEVAAHRLWPELSLAICWRSPMLASYLSLLAPHVGQRVAQRDYLMMASEGVMAIPVADGESGGVCAVGVHLYEFVPEAAYEHANPPVLSPHELTVGEHYVVILSNGAGLCRYDIGDVVRVTGFVHGTPSFEFLHRVGRTCSLTGEKLTEAQVSAAVDAVAAALNTPTVSFTLAPAQRGFPHYVALVEFAGQPPPEALARFAAALDTALGERNGEYRSKRASQRLHPPELLRVAPGSFAAQRRTRAVGTTSDSQVKPVHLSRDPSTAAAFEILERFGAS